MHKPNSKTDTVQKLSKEAKDEAKEEDYVTKSIGAFGLWQFIYIQIASLTRIVTTFNTLSIVFIAPETHYKCTKFDDNTTVQVVQSTNTCSDSCIEYEYADDVFKETLISQFGLICENSWLQSFAQMIVMLGILCGVSLFGWFSDRFGRSRGMVLSGITCTISMFATHFCPNFWSVSAARFFAGIGTGGYLALTAVYMSELVGPKFVDIITCAFLLPFDGLGLPMLALFAYFTTTWRTFMLMCSFVTVFVVCFTWFLPETPRWLIAKGKKSEAVDLMTKAAKFNKRDTLNIKEYVTKVTEQLNVENKTVNLTYLDLFRTKKMAVCTVASASIWFVTGFSYHGLLQYISQFGTNLYIVVTILGVVQIAAAPLAVVIVKFCGRRVSSVCIYLTIGVISLALIFTPKGSTAAVVLGALGVTAASISFSVVYIIVIELYPTTIRNMGLGFSSAGSKVAAIVAPFVVNMKTKWISSSIFAVVGLSAVIFCFILPETKGKKLKDTIDDLE